MLWTFYPNDLDANGSFAKGILLLMVVIGPSISVVFVRVCVWVMLSRWGWLCISYCALFERSVLFSFGFGVGILWPLPPSRCWWCLGCLVKMRESNKGRFIRRRAKHYDGMRYIHIYFNIYVQFGVVMVLTGKSMIVSIIALRREKSKLLRCANNGILANTP